MTDFITDGPKDAECHLMLAHGAGAPMTSPFLDTMAELLVARQIRVTRFEFPFMARRRVDGRRRPPPRAELLARDYVAIVEDRKRLLPAGQKLFIGGKSLGGRVATLVANELRDKHVCDGVICLGYPFHPAGKPDRLRTAHLANIASPALIIQGERDPLGNREEVASYDLSPAITLFWVADGDHDLKPRVRSGFTLSGNLTSAADAIVGRLSGR